MIYTREEVKNMLENIGTYTEESIEYFIDEMTSIEISDEEIVQKALEVGFTNTLFIDGAKWYREQLKKKQ